MVIDSAETPAVVLSGACLRGEHERCRKGALVLYGAPIDVECECDCGHPRPTFAAGPERKERPVLRQFQRPPGGYSCACGHQEGEHPMFRDGQQALPRTCEGLHSASLCGCESDEAWCPYRDRSCLCPGLDLSGIAHPDMTHAFCGTWPIRDLLGWGEGSIHWECGVQKLRWYHESSVPMAYSHSHNMARDYGITLEAKGCVRCLEDLTPATLIVRPVVPVDFEKVLVADGREGYYRAASSRDVELGYLVQVSPDGERAVCDCPGNNFGNDCWHVQQALQKGEPK